MGLKAIELNCLNDAFIILNTPSNKNKIKSKNKTKPQQLNSKASSLTDSINMTSLEAAVSTQDINQITSVVSNLDKVLIHEQLAIEHENTNPQTSFGKFMKAMEVPHEGKPLSILRNPDLEPVSAENQTYGITAISAYWSIPNCSIMTYSTGGALIGLGLNAKSSIVAIVIANLAISFYIVLSGFMGFKYHIGFGLTQRMVFGIKGSYFGVLVRMGLSLVMFGYLSWSGGLCVNMMLDALSHHYLHLPNYFPDSVQFNTKDFVGFLIFQIICYPMAFIHPRKVGSLSLWSCVFTFFGVMGIFIYITHKAGPGPLWYSHDTTTSKSQTGWMWLYAMTIWYSGVGAPVTNQNDYTRFVPGRKQFWSNIVISISLTITATLVCTWGMIVGSGCIELYGEAYYLPYEITEQWLTDNYSGKARAASFFLGLAFTFCQLMLNMTQNAYAIGMDLTTYAPKFIDIKRGTIVCLLLSWVTCPWTFFGSSSKFLDVMGAFGVFTLPISALGWIEYWFVRKCKLSLIDFFTMSSKGSYWYWHGFNVRALVCCLIGMVLGFPGLYYSCNPDVEPNAGMMNYFYGYMYFIPVVTASVYVISHLLFPLKHEKLAKNDPVDYFNCFTPEECAQLGMLKYDGNLDVYQFIDAQNIDGVDTDSLTQEKVVKEEKS